MEVENQPTPALDDAAVKVTADTLMQALNPEDAARVERMGSDHASVTRKDLCWILRKKLDATVFLASPYRQVWVRALVHGKPQRCKSWRDSESGV